MLETLRRMEGTVRLRDSIELGGGDVRMGICLELCGGEEVGG